MHWDVRVDDDLMFIYDHGKARNRQSPHIIHSAILYFLISRSENEKPFETGQTFTANSNAIAHWHMKVQYVCECWTDIHVDISQIWINTPLVPFLAKTHSNALQFLLHFQKNLQQKVWFDVLLSNGSLSQQTVANVHCGYYR